jgi:hypothetical protein
MGPGACHACAAAGLGTAVVSLLSSARTSTTEIDISCSQLHDRCDSGLSMQGWRLVAVGDTATKDDGTAALALLRGLGGNSTRVSLAPPRGGGSGGGGSSSSSTPTFLPPPPQAAANREDPPPLLPPAPLSSSSAAALLASQGQPDAAPDPGPGRSRVHSNLQRIVRGGVIAARCGHMFEAYLCVLRVSIGCCLGSSVWLCAAREVICQTCDRFASKVRQRKGTVAWDLNDTLEAEQEDEEEEADEVDEPSRASSAAVLQLLKEPESPAARVRACEQR